MKTKKFGTNFDGIKKTASKNLASEINWAGHRKLSAKIKKQNRKTFIKYFVIGLIISLGTLIIMNEMLGNPIYQYFLNK